jgi:hypothetical protein
LISWAGRLTAAVADGETPYRSGAEVTTARNVRSGWKRLARRLLAAQAQSCQGRYQEAL